jgi:hypothetical protein
MSVAFNRRKFVQLLGALSAELGLRGNTAGTAVAQQTARTAIASRAPNRSETINRKNFVGIQVKPFVWMDEGIDKALDTLQEKGNVNTVFVYTYDYDPNRTTNGGAIPLPDHGKYGSGKLRNGGAFYDYDQKYFRNTTIKDFRSPDEPNFNVITAVAPKMKARGMDFFAWDYNNAFPVMMQNIPGFTEVAEIDVYGRRTTSACFNNPDYRAHLTGKIESYLSQYSSEVNGVMWGCERMGPIDNMIGGGWATTGISCFCSFCVAKGTARGISVDRAKLGYIKLDQLFRAAAQHQRPPDGFFVVFMRTLFQYPEILSWNSLWNDSYHEVRSELYGTAKSIAPQKPFGFHIVQNVTFSPFYSAVDDYSKVADYADFLKIASYNNAGGPRMAHFLDRLCSSVFADATPDDLRPLYYKMMGYNEAGLGEILTNGLSPQYVATETKRAIEGTGGRVQIYPGIDIDVPSAKGEKHTTPEDVRAATRIAFSSGANGVVLSREYHEMWLANLSAAGETTRQIFSGGIPS